MSNPNPGAALQAFRAMISAADTGPLLQTELIPLTNQGKLRVTYNWLYSSLNCVSGDATTFAWTISKLDATHVSLSPRDGYGGMTLYASVRDDINWLLQVQAPYSADWITAVGRDETIEMDSLDSLMVSFKGFNGNYIAVNGQMSDHGGHSGYRLQSLGAADAKARIWFMAVTQILQPGLRIPLRGEVTETDIRQAYAACGLTASEVEVAQVRRQLV
ncbi:MAG TPA: hypothetical protein VH023_19990 [Rhodopila sp.]|nr:hypothetical protein [Rhodopila sp.]